MLLLAKLMFEFGVADLQFYNRVADKPPIPNTVGVQNLSKVKSQCYLMFVSFLVEEKGAISKVKTF